MIYGLDFQFVIVGLKISIRLPKMPIYPKMVVTEIKLDTRTVRVNHGEEAVAGILFIKKRALNTSLDVELFFNLDQVNMILCMYIAAFSDRQWMTGYISYIIRTTYDLVNRG